MNQAYEVGQMDLAWWAIAGGVGLVVVIVLYILALYGRTVAWPQEHQPGESSEEQDFQNTRAVPWIVLLVWLGAIVFAIGHTLWTAMLGSTRM